MKLPLSVIIITKNEEKNIAACLAGVASFAAEIIVVDSKSTDNTVAIARKYTKKIICATFKNYKEKRHCGLHHATQDWILFLDADERISEQGEAEIRRVILSKDSADGYCIPFKHFFLGKWLRYGGWYPSYLPRLAKRSMCTVTNPIHELLAIKGKKSYLKNPILHLGDQSLFERISKSNKYTSFQAKQGAFPLFFLVHLCFLPLGRFIKGYIFKQGFRDGILGFIRFVLYSFTLFIVYAKKFELKQDPATYDHLEV